MFSTDSISRVGFNITKSFAKSGDNMVFNHVDFTYTFSYKSRVGKINEQEYSIKTNAILYVYDFDNSFELPMFDYSANAFRGRDYREINAMPYSDFFWENNDEYRLNDRKNTNKQFFDDSNSITNKAMFKPSTKMKTGLFEHPFVHWSRNRVRFREVMEDTTKAAPSASFNSEKYDTVRQY